MRKEQLSGENLFFHAADPEFIYVANYKAAYTSVLTSLLDTFPHIGAALWEQGLPSGVDFGQHVVFTFVRHPADRVRSCYFDKIVVTPRDYLGMAEVPAPQECQATVYRAAVEHLDGGGGTGLPSHRSVLERLRRLTFPEFVALLPHICLQDVHFYPQSLWLDRFPTLRERLFVGRVETFARDWRVVGERIGRALPLLHENSTDYRRADGEAHLDDRSLRTIQEVYAADYRDFYPGWPDRRPPAQ
jgi:hypothetical protein